MYKLALLQNDSEMLRYSWANLQPFLEESFEQYTTITFTRENIDKLFLSILDFDAIIIATNACNDKKILESLTNHKDKINTFLKCNKGLLIIHQMRSPGRL